MSYTPGVLNPKTFLTGGRKLYVFLGGRATLLMLLLYSDTPPPRPPTFRLVQDIFEPNLFRYKYPNNLVPVTPPANTAYDYGIECFETSAHKIKTPGNNPKEIIQHSEHGDSFKSRIGSYITLTARRNKAVHPVYASRDQTE
jgi:hypothetical protein